MIFILALICASALALYFNRKIISTIPATVCLCLIVTYILGITNHLSRSIMCCMIEMVIFTIGFILLYVKIEKVDSKTLIKSWLNKYKELDLWLFVILASAIFVLFNNHFVTNWDDFNYWANFTKNITVIDTFVSGTNSATAYKDYPPMVQLFSYIVMKSLGGFSENRMFAANNLLLLIFLVPFFEKRKTAAILTGILIIPALSFQPLHCLGVDIIIAAVFGYSLIRIIAEDRRDLFFYTEMALVLSVLVLVKSVSLVVVIVLISLIITDGFKKNKKIPLVILFCLPPVLTYLSWQIFCRVKGNISYLTQAADDSIKGGGFLNFPDYGMQVVKAFFVKMFTMPFNGGELGATFFICLVFVIAVIKSYLEANKTYKIYFAEIFIGFAVNIIGLLYTYLFVFVKWEALSLSSYDRYISMYITGIVILAAYLFTTVFLQDKKRAYLAFALPATLCLSLNYSLLISVFGPGNFEKLYSDIYSKRTIVETKIDTVFENYPEYYGKRIVIVTEENDEMEKYLQYGFVPAVTFVEHIQADNEELIREKIEEHNAVAAYVVSLEKIVEK